LFFANVPLKIFLINFRERERRERIRFKDCIETALCCACGVATMEDFYALICDFADEVIIEIYTL
jgi:hypothetical protein